MDYQERKKRKFKIEHWQKVGFLLMIYDMICVNLSFFLGLWIRFDGGREHIPEAFYATWKAHVPIYTLICIVVFMELKLYRSIWRYASESEILRVIWATVLTTGIYYLLMTRASVAMPISMYITGPVFQVVLISLGRFGHRIYQIFASENGKKKKSRSNIMVIGAGDCGEVIIKEIVSKDHLDKKVRCIIDDNSNKWKRYLCGVPIVGGRDVIMSNVEKYKIDEIYMAMPSAPAEAKRDILNICNETGCNVKSLPGVYQFVSGEVSVSAFKNVKIEDLLGREPIKVATDEIFESLKGKVILVTGGGGSIGSELCRQIANHAPEKLVIFDIYENNAYNIEQELLESHPELNFKVEIGSVRDSRRMIQLFDTYRPDIVYHAAAHKHVPLMESSPSEAIKNNVIGTYKTAYAAAVYNCSRFVLISTDKAVNPLNVMGASKRLCEMVIQSFNGMLRSRKGDRIPQLYTHEGAPLPDILKGSRTEYVAVRFGNVLGSNGSVIPLFKKQIAEGGPVTVTHPDIIRYFMTIPEAVSLVLEAGVYARGGEIFVLDMGEPVKIDTLARNLISLSGLRPDKDIKIVYSGLRPGEKLYEEKLMAEEGLKKTSNSLIHIGLPIAFDNEKFMKDLKELMEAGCRNDAHIRQWIQKMVPTYQPGKEQ